MRRLKPDGPAAALAGDAASTEQIAITCTSLGLYRSTPARFGPWFGPLLSADLGRSYCDNTELTKRIGQRLEPTLSMALITALAQPSITSRAI